MCKILSIAFVMALFIFPALAYGKVSSGDASFIDTAMPASIPAEIKADWKKMDSAELASDSGYSAAIAKIKSGLPPEFASKIDTGSTKALYIKACHFRRVARIQPFSTQLKKLLCARHYNEGGPMIGYLEDLDSENVGSIGGHYPGIAGKSRGDQYKAGAALLVLNFDNYYPSPTALLEDKTGVVRDPCVSFDGKRIAFAWSKDNNGYSIFEMDITKPDSVRQLTYDLPHSTVSDYEPCYLPNGDILFNSSRCFQGLSDDFNIVSNLFIMNKDGKYLRRICFDQAHDFHPTVMSDGRIMFSRWEFLDRNDATVFGVFTMNPDGTLQNEYFGNQLSWPNTFPNAREIPNSRGKFLSIIGGFMGRVYQGDLVLVNTQIGRNTIDAIQLIAPKRTAKPVISRRGPIDPDRKFQDPYPLNSAWFLISYAANPINTLKYRLYLMDVDGNRELLAWDANQSISQPFPLCERKGPRLVCKADYSKTTGELTMANAYFGTGIDSSVKAGSIKKIRAIGLEYRMYPWIGETGSTSFTFTPLGRFGGSGESKRILGEMKVEADGSAAFIVPSRTPLYVQLIDSNGCMIQSMRSWMTLQPGEKFDCFGCHEDKNNAPPPVGPRIASTPKKLEPFYDVLDGYMYYPTRIQPIFNAKCVSCHDAGHSSGLDLSGDTIWTGNLINYADNKTAERFWCKSYLNLTDPKKNLVSYISIMSSAEGLRPNSVGAGRSKLIEKLRQRSGEMAGVVLTEEETAKLCAWIDLCIPHGGKYTDDMKPEHAAWYETRFALRMKEDSLEQLNIEEFVKSGGYNSPDYGGIPIRNGNQGKLPFSNALSGDPMFKVSFSHGSRQLVVKLPCAGIVTLVDLQGRRLFTMNISEDDYAKSPARNAALRVPPGLYVAKFKGRSFSAERIVPVL